jgi:DNA-binding HxlR family transcriptional regulator
MGAATQTATEPADEPAVHATSNGQRSPCCALYHHAVELVGKRWTGAILLVLMDGRLRFSEIRQLVPDVSDRLLSERLKELEGEGIVERKVYDETPVRVEYGLTEKGQALEPALAALKSWSHTHCTATPSGSSGNCR